MFHCYWSLSYIQLTASIYILKVFFIFLTCDANVMDPKLVLARKPSSLTATVTDAEMKGRSETGRWNAYSGRTEGK